MGMALGALALSAASRSLACLHIATGQECIMQFSKQIISWQVVSMRIRDMSIDTMSTLCRCLQKYAIRNLCIFERIEILRIHCLDICFSSKQICSLLESLPALASVDLKAQVSTFVGFARSIRFCICDLYLEHA